MGEMAGVHERAGSADKGRAVEPLAYSINEAARALSVGRDKIYALIAQRKLKAVKLGKRTVIPRSSILAMLEAA